MVTVVGEPLYGEVGENVGVAAEGLVMTKEDELDGESVVPVPPATA